MIFLSKAFTKSIIFIEGDLGTNSSPPIIISIGIRPGEKLHEILCPEDSSRDTLEFKDYYLIRPTFYHADSTKSKNNSYKINKNNEKGKFVKSNFIYNSSTNSHFLSVKELKKFI